jgi:hypothetical protein
MDQAAPQVSRYALYAVLALVFVNVIWPHFTGGHPDKLKDTLETGLVLVTVLTQVLPKKQDAQAEPAPAFHLAPSFMSGWYGGMVGGAVAGLIVAPAYYFSARGGGHDDDALQLTPIIFGWAVLAGFFFGATSQLGAQLARHAANSALLPAPLANEITGALLGGAVAGFCVGAYGGWLFGYRHLPSIDPILLCIGGVVGAFAVCGGTLLYDYRGRYRYVGRLFFFSLIPTMVAVGIAFYLVVASGIIDNHFAPWDTRITNLAGGAYLGALLGAALGIQVGCTLLLARLTRRVGSLA